MKVLRLAVAREHGLDEDLAQQAMRNDENLDLHFSARFATHLMTQLNEIDADDLVGLKEFY